MSRGPELPRSLSPGREIDRPWATLPERSCGWRSFRPASGRCASAMPATPELDDHNAALATSQRKLLLSYGLQDLLPKTVG
jgi:hypothetical protein